jgi:hypothetical protein
LNHQTQQTPRKRKSTKRLKTPPSKHKLKTSSPQSSLAMLSLLANPANRRKRYNAKEISFMKKIFENFLTSKTRPPKMPYVKEVFNKNKNIFQEGRTRYIIPGHFFNSEHSPYLFPMFNSKKHRSMHCELLCNQLYRTPEILK